MSQLGSHIASIAALARVPEHSPGLMRAFSGGEPIRLGSHLFFATRDSLLAIAYPLSGKYDEKEFLKALDAAMAKSGASTCYAIGPDAPGKFKILEKDRYYLLSATAEVPKRLKNPVAKAASHLRVVENSRFTPAHRRLWAEFMTARGSTMNERVAELYARTPQILDGTRPHLRFLDAYDASGNLGASLLLDYEPANFVSYILGAHSAMHYTPHAVDLLFGAMLERARTQGKRFIHLGLGVNDGILRFKLKWGARPYFPFVMSTMEKAPDPEIASPGAIAVAMLRAPQISGRKLIENQAETRPFAMLWRVEKKGRISWLGGTAHFFRYSFESSFRKLFRNVENVIFEGPLDPGFMAEVSRRGRIQPKGATPLIELLTQDELARLERTVCGPKGLLARSFGLERRHLDIAWLLRHAMPWCAFFTLWTTFLERLGWHESVDMEAWRIANDMGKNVIAMENMDEQLESLGSLPVDRVVRFFRACDGWKARARRNLAAYLAGDLEKMMGSSAEFPTRTEHVVGRRDQRFRERMRPYLEAGKSAVFVGSAHLVNLRHMLVEDGFNVRQTPFGLLPKLRLGLRGLWRPDEGIKW